MFKLHLGKLQDHLKPKIPVEYKKAITDYLREMGKVITNINYINFNWIISYNYTYILFIVYKKNSWKCGGSEVLWKRSFDS